MSEEVPTTEINEIEQLKAKVAELEAKLNKPKRQYDTCECPECHKILKNKFILKTHINNVHNNQRKKFPCPHCGKELKSKYYLQNHINAIHADELKMEERNVSIEVIETNETNETLN